MARYFMEVSYKGSNYAGFQIQKNANSIQAEVEKALTIFYKNDFVLTGSSRTDAGVHAIKNYFHFDSEKLAHYKAEDIDQSVYNLNSILPPDIVINKIYKVSEGAHCRFDALSREYNYYIYQNKDPFQADRAYYYPYNLNIDILQQVAKIILRYNDFSAFSKKNSQVTNFKCDILQSSWSINRNLIIYSVSANRFLRGMVKGLVGTMLKAGTGKISVEDFCKVIESGDCTLANFSVPPHGLVLMNVHYSNNLPS